MCDCENNMREEANVGLWTDLIDKCNQLEEGNKDLQNNHMKLYNDTKDEIRRLEEENTRLQKELQAEKRVLYKSR